MGQSIFGPALAGAESLDRTGVAMGNEPRKPAPATKSKTDNPFDVEGEEGERRSGEYSFVYHEVARITTVRKLVPARRPDPKEEDPSGT